MEPLAESTDDPIRTVPMVLPEPATAVAVTVRESLPTNGKYGLRGDHVQRPAASLSPGERTRASLASLMAVGVNFLVLDEPTNHLDLPAIEQLEVALEAFDGTLLVVTHDRELLDAIELDRTVTLP